MCQETNKQKNHLQQTPYDYWNKYKNMQNMTTYVEKPKILLVLQKKPLFFPCVVIISSVLKFTK